MTELPADQGFVFLGEVPATDLAFHIFTNTPALPIGMFLMAVQFLFQAVGAILQEGL